MFPDLRSCDYFHLCTVSIGILHHPSKLIFLINYLYLFIAMQCLSIFHNVILIFIVIVVFSLIKFSLSTNREKCKLDSLYVIDVCYMLF